MPKNKSKEKKVKTALFDLLDHNTLIPVIDSNDNDIHIVYFTKNTENLDILFNETLNI